jgi:integrase
VSRGGCGRRGPRVSVSAPGRANNLRRVYKAAVDAAGADLGHLDLRGPHDLRHTFSTWLEDAGIPARVIDELMGHEAAGRSGQRGSAMGAHYRHTTPEMAARVVDAIQQRLSITLDVAQQALEDRPNWSELRVF